MTAAHRPAFDQLVTMLGERTVTADPATLTVGVATDGTARGVRDLLDRIDPGRNAVRSFGVRTATLDDAFLALTGHTATTEKETADV